MKWYFGSRKLPAALSALLATVALLFGIGLTATVVATPAAAVGNYNNADIATKALSYVGRWGGAACNDAQKPGDSGGQCRAFVNCIVWMVSNHTQNLGGSDYYQPFIDAGGTRITDESALIKGDIVQVGQGTHTFIIVSHVSGNTFNVVDSNHNEDEMVMNYNRTFTLDDTTRAYRMGLVGTTAPSSSGKPSAVSYNGGGYSEMDVFIRGGGDVYKDTWNGSSWSGFSDMGGGNIVSNPVAVQYGAELDVFAVDSNNHLVKDTWNGSTWSGFNSLGGSVAGNPAAIQFNSGSYHELDVYARGTDGALYKDTWNGSFWSGVSSLGGGGLAADPAVVQYGAEMDVYIRSGVGQVYKDTWNGSSWSGLNSLGGNVASSPAAVVYGSEMDVYAGTGSDGYMFKDTWNGSTWSGFNNMGGGLAPATTPAAISYNGEMDVYVRGSNNQILKDTWNGSFWSGYNSLGGPSMSGDATAIQFGSEMDVFATGSDGHLYKDTWNGSSWGGFSSLN